MPAKQTKRERKELAKKQRLEEMRRTVRRRRMQKLTSIATAVLAIALVTGLVLWNNARNRAAAEKRNRAINVASAALGCSKVQEPTEASSAHIEPPNKAESYTSEPPTSGQHYNARGLGPVNTGVHESPVEDEGSVHNLEHGHVMIHYAPDAVSKRVLDEVSKFVKANATTMLMAPRVKPAFADKDALAITAWNRVVHCPKTMKDDPVQVKALVEAFYGKYLNQAPETAPGQPNA